MYFTIGTVIAILAVIAYPFVWYKWILPFFIEDSYDKAEATVSGCFSLIVGLFIVGLLVAIWLPAIIVGLIYLLVRWLVGKKYVSE
jgi:hypothetical protein